MSIETVESVVIGAGVVGLACARQLAREGRECIIVEAESAIGTQTSSRNSEVIHAGIYYPTRSLKAQLCCSGREMLYAYCREHTIPYKKLGKLIVATSLKQLEKLNEIVHKAAINGVPDLQMLDSRQVTELEPEVHCLAALLSKQTGIIDSHNYMLALQGDFEDAGGVIAFQSPVLAARVDNNGIILEIGGKDPTILKAKQVIVATGNQTPNLLERFVGIPETNKPAHWFAKGNYFSLSGKSPFSHLVYPIPQSGGLGIHATVDLQGKCRFGPDVEWTDDPYNYTVDPALRDKFFNAISRYWPQLQKDRLQPDYAGIRPKLNSPAQPAVDFVIEGPEDHGVDGLVNLLGIESPGLTSSLAIASHAVKKINMSL